MLFFVSEERNREQILIINVNWGICCTWQRHRRRMAGFIATENREEMEKPKIGSQKPNSPLWNCNIKNSTTTSYTVLFLKTNSPLRRLTFFKPSASSVEHCTFYTGMDLFYNNNTHKDQLFDCKSAEHHQLYCCIEVILSIWKSCVRPPTMSRTQRCVCLSFQSSL